jgi:AcrR family transcriptional regulator
MPRRVDAHAPDRILAAAKELLASRGFELKVEDIASHAGVGVASIYRVWQTKEELISEVIEEMISESEKELERIGASPPNAVTAVTQANGVGFERVREYGLLAMVAFSGAMPEPYASQFNPRQAGLGPYFGHLIKLGIEQGHFRPDLDVRYSVLLWQGIVSPHALGNMLAHYPLGEVRDKTNRVLLRAFGYSEEAE